MTTQLDALPGEYRCEAVDCVFNWQRPHYHTTPVTNPDKPVVSGTPTYDAELARTFDASQAATWTLVRLQISRGELKKLCR